MVKIRLMGTPEDIKWFKQALNHHQEIRVAQFSDLFVNKGTNKYVRAYGQVEKRNRGEKDV